MGRGTGLVLRITGPLIEVACLVLLFSFPGRRLSPAGIPLDDLLYAGLALGFAMVLIGLSLSGRSGREARSEEAAARGPRHRRATHRPPDLQ
ncbi:MAG TPA: hypothetical protein VF590_22145 [Isosphaeraceae bacterium]|jgi:hypothetical protein